MHVQADNNQPHWRASATQIHDEYALVHAILVSVPTVIDRAMLSALSQWKLVVMDQPPRVSVRVPPGEPQPYGVRLISRVSGY